MAFDYSGLGSLCCEQIAQFGGEATFRQAVHYYNPVRGEMTDDKTEFRAPALMTSPDEQALASGLANTGDGVLLVAAKDMAEAPRAGEAVIWNGQEWRMVSIASVAPAGEALLYKITVRRA